MKYLFYILIGIALGVFIMLFFKGCEKKVYIKGKSWTVTKYDTIRYSKTRYIPKILYKLKRDTVVFNDSIISYKDSLSIYKDSVTLGKALILISDTVNGVIANREVTCVGCGYDSIFVNRVDTLEKRAIEPNFGAGVCLIPFPPYISPCIYLGIGKPFKYPKFVYK
jgi:hypothetical protein